MNFVTKENGKRVIFVFKMVLLMVIVIVARLGYVQIIKDKKITDMATNKVNKKKTITPTRGEILDRNHMKLAINSYTYDVWISKPTKSDLTKIDVAAKRLSIILNKEESQLKEQLLNADGLEKIATGLNKETADKLNDVVYTSVWTEKKLKRVYPYDNFAAQVLGHMNTESKDGIYGVEASYNDVLKGVEGKLTATTDAEGKELPVGESVEIPVENGSNVVLTIDQAIQHYTERALDRVVTEQKPKRAMAIVMDPNTAEILAMSTKPDYNPNRPWDLSVYYKNSELKKMTDKKQSEMLGRMWINPIISETYEPGSIFKPLTVAAALLEGVITPYSTFYDKGYIRIAGNTIRNWDLRAHGKMTVIDAVDKSTNTVLVQIGQRMKISNFYDRLKSFGVMEKTGIDLPAESNPITIPKDKVGPSEAATMTYGHGISITPIQNIVAISAFVNGGKLMKPYIVKAIEDENGNVVKEIQPTLVRNVATENVSKDMKMILESVVEKGSGRMCQIPGVRLGGKTGTTIKLINGKYSYSKVISSFVGVATIDNPSVVVLVVVDEPRGSTMSSIVSVPVAKEILQNVINYSKIKTENSKSSMVRMPTLVGSDLEKAKYMADALGIELEVSPEDYKEDLKRKVVSQSPAAGTMIKKGIRAKIKLK